MLSVSNIDDAQTRASRVLELLEKSINEIPIYLQKLQYVAFTSYLGLVLCLLWNIIAQKQLGLKEKTRRCGFLLLFTSYQEFHLPTCYGIVLFIVHLGVKVH